MNGAATKVANGTMRGNCANIGTVTGRVASVAASVTPMPEADLEKRAGATCATQHEAKGPSTTSPSTASTDKTKLRL